MHGKQCGCNRLQPRRDATNNLVVACWLSKVSWCHGLWWCHGLNNRVADDATSEGQAFAAWGWPFLLVWKLIMHALQGCGCTHNC